MSETDAGPEAYPLVLRMVDGTALRFYVDAEDVEACEGAWAAHITDEDRAFALPDILAGTLWNTDKDPATAVFEYIRGDVVLPDGTRGRAAIRVRDISAFIEATDTTHVADRTEATR